MSQPPPTDLEKSLDGLLAGLDNLLASRDRLASAQSIPVDNNAEVGLPSEADWEFLGLVASVGWVALSPDRVAGMARGARAMLRRHLRRRAATFALANGRSHLLSPRWARLMRSLGEDLLIDQTDDTEGLLLSSVKPVLPSVLLHDLASLAGPVGETLTLIPMARGQAVYLPSFPELGLATQAAQSPQSPPSNHGPESALSAVHWSFHEGEPCLFFWLDDHLEHQPEVLGMGLLGSGETRLILRRP
jgi:hypothetical protein